MRGNEILKSALVLLDTSGMESGIKESIPNIALGAINDIGSDLFGDFKAERLFDEIPLKKSELSAFVYGVAMVLSAAFGLVEKNRYLTECYNKRRAAVKCKIERVKNRVPFVLGETV